MSDEQNEINQWNDDESNEGAIRYTCSDGVKIRISLDKAKQSSAREFTDYLDSRAEHTDYLTNGTLMGWQDFYVEARFRTLKGEDQIREEVSRTRRDWKADVDSVLFFDDEEFQND